jgi:hypothetical protein
VWRHIFDSTGVLHPLIRSQKLHGPTFR